MRCVHATGKKCIYLKYFLYLSAKNRNVNFSNYLRGSGLLLLLLLSLLLLLNRLCPGNYLFC